MCISYKNLATLSLLALIITACGGSSTSDGPGPSGGGGDPSDVDGISYLPLNVLETTNTFYYGATPPTLSGYFSTPQRRPYNFEYLINPINSATLAPVPNATVDNYQVNIDEIVIDDTESHPILQKVIGVDVLLTTTLLFDLSSSADSVNMQALVDEAKIYIAAAQASSNSIIKNQVFNVAAFAENFTFLTPGGFTSNSSTLSNALDEVVTLFNNKNLGTSSELHFATVLAIGRFIDPDYDFRSPPSIADPITGLIYSPFNLYDTAGADGTILSQLVLFSTGPDTRLTFDQESMLTAINSQAFVKYTGPSTGETTNLPKTVFYYVTGSAVAPGTTYGALAEVAETTSNLNLVGGNYSFSSNLIQNQITAINKRINFSNQYVYRFAFIPRFGDHEVVFDSKSSSFSYKLTGNITDPGFYDAADAREAMLGPHIYTEIAGPNGEFISGNNIDFSEAQTFSPATRWTNDVYGTGDYSWSLSGGTGTVNSNGTYTINTIAGASATLTLTNLIRAENTSIEIIND